MTDYLTAILARTRAENSRRRRHLAARPPVLRPADLDRADHAIRALRRRPDQRPSVIAEVKFRSPSAGVIRQWRPGEAVRIAERYERAGASVVSVLADGPAFGGSPLLVRRVAHAVGVPVLFKGFVLDPIQVDLAYDVGASLVLLLVRALEDANLRELIEHTRSLGMEPVVEAANVAEVDRAIGAGSTIVGVNARDLSTFGVDREAARVCIERIPPRCVAVFMSGIRSGEDFRAVARGRADAVLIGEELMRFEDPGARLSQLVSSF
ncbi:MAG: indole-3-glycerol-phosphate synthase [Polyangiales bacterium]